MAEAAYSTGTVASVGPYAGQSAPPRLILLGALLMGIAVAWLTILTAVDRPWLGLDLRADEPAGTVLVKARAGDGPAALSDLAPGIRIEWIEAARGAGASGARPGLSLEATDLIEEPDSLDSYALIERFLERQSEFAGILRRDAVRVHFTDPATGARGTADLAPQTRPVRSLPIAFWVQLFSGLAGFWTGAWVWSLRRGDLASLMFALSGAGLMLSALPAAIYSTRELAIEGDLFTLLGALNHAGVHVFGGALIALFLLYPRRLVAPVRLVALPIVLGAWLWADVARAAPDPAIGMYVPMLAEMATIVALVVIQARRIRNSPAERAALRWLGLSVIVGAGAFVTGIAMPLLLGNEPVLSQGFAFAFFLIIYGGIALGIRHYRLFDLGEWSFRVAFYVFGALLLLALDAALLWLLNVERTTALGASLLFIAFLYLPLRDGLASRITGKRGIARHELFSSVLEVAFAATPAQRSEGWRQLLARLYDPLEIGPAADAPAVLRSEADGTEMVFPATADSPPLRLRYPGAGRGLFDTADLKLAQELVRLIEEAEHSRGAYDRGAVEERQRIARDLHDDVGGRLLTGMHGAEVATRHILQSALSDIRSIVSGLNGERVPLNLVLADARHEAARRLEAAAISLDWPIPENDDADNILLDYRQAKTLTSCIRESVTNIIRHAGARTVRTQITVAADSLSLSVSDDGRGFAQAAGEGFGLRNIRQRTEAVAGAATIRSGAAGTTVTIAMPRTCG